MPDRQRLLELALKGLEAERATIDGEIIQIKSQLNPRSTTPQTVTAVRPTAVPSKKRRMSAAARKRISEGIAGGICASYHVVPGQHQGKGPQRMFVAPDDGESYRFEIGGGHWLWGGDPMVIGLRNSFGPMGSYLRHAAAYLPEKELFVPYPLQN